MLHILMLCIYLWLLLISSVVHTYITHQKFIEVYNLNSKELWIRGLFGSKLRSCFTCIFDSSIAKLQDYLRN